MKNTFGKEDDDEEDDEDEGEDCGKVSEEVKKPKRKKKPPPFPLLFPSLSLLETVMETTMVDHQREVVIGFVERERAPMRKGTVGKKVRTNKKQRTSIKTNL